MYIYLTNITIICEKGEFCSHSVVIFPLYMTLDGVFFVFLRRYEVIGVKDR